tara:strand:+ start:128 stop:607 length:480 start_codon:yes stop_codon:yes gene_type:complete
MNKKQLIKIIELVVRKEVKKQVNEIFINENKSDSLNLKSLTEEELKQPIRKKQTRKKEPVQYSSNPVLNKVLNETVGGLEGKGEQDEYPTLGGGTFDSSRMTEMLGYGADNKEVQREVGAVQTMKEAGVTTDQVPESLVNALTRDYSDLMNHSKMKSKK